MKKVYTYDLKFGGRVNMKNIRKECSKLGLKYKKRGKFVDIYK